MASGSFFVFCALLVCFLTGPATSSQVGASGGGGSGCTTLNNILKGQESSGDILTATILIWLNSQSISCACTPDANGLGPITRIELANEDGTATSFSVCQPCVGTEVRDDNYVVSKDWPVQNNANSVKDCSDVKFYREEMSDYKLTYFDGRGRAEIVRLIFAAAGVAFEDVRLSTEEQWLQLKPKTPFGQLPVLETPEGVFYQSLAIARYLARKFGLAGKTEVEEIKVDSMVDAIEDTMRPIPQFWRYETDEKKKEALKKVYLEETLPNNLNNLEKLLKSNKNGEGYFVGESLTWSDLHLLNLLAMLEVQVNLTDPFEKHPKLKELAQRVSGQQLVAGYLANRPPSIF